MRVSASGWALCLCLFAAMLLPVEAAQACDTPVYHYTIQMWQRDAYHVYCFYKGPEETAATPRPLIKSSMIADGLFHLRDGAVMRSDWQFQIISDIASLFAGEHRSTLPRASTAGWGYIVGSLVSCTSKLAGGIALLSDYPSA